MVDEEADAALVQLLVTAEGERLANQVGTALTQRVVEAFTMCCFACFLADWAMSLRRSAVRVDRVAVAVTDRTLAIVGRE